MLEKINKFKVEIHGCNIIGWVKYTPLQWCVLENTWDNFNQKDTEIEIEYANGDFGIYTIDYFRRHIL